MGQTSRGIAMAVALLSLGSIAGAQGAKPLTKCPADAVVSGTVCMDKYEASVWRVPDPAGVNRGLVKRIQQGKATSDDLTAGGASQLGTSIDDYAPCADGGQSCVDDIYAVSLPGVTPSHSITWFQAQAACENARKRLPSNAEWQAAVAGTRDPGPDDWTTDCNTTAIFALPTGSRSACASADGAFDMVGNLWEWVADWIPRATACGTWSANVSPTGDVSCVGGAATAGGPAALQRSGSFLNGNNPELIGPFTVYAIGEPSGKSLDLGFRCAR